MKTMSMTLALCLALVGCAADEDVSEQSSPDDEVSASEQPLAGPGAEGPDYDPPPPGSKPDLTVSLPTPAFYLEAKPNSSGNREDHIMARATVKNVGNWSTDTLFKMRMYIRDQLNDGYVIASHVVSTSKLEPGQQRQLVVDFGLRANWLNVHNVDIVAVADSNSAISESNETNNKGFYYVNDF